ncbi:MAG: ribokinase [Mycetocola sp.]
MSVVVLGSANLDLVYAVDRIPSPGETVLATGFASYPGGKGNNQVTAVARAGADVTFIAALGTDAAADLLLESLTTAGVRDLIRRIDEPTGTALITVDASAENTIIVNSGANAHLVDLTETELAAIGDARLLLLQLETPLATVLAAARHARAAGTMVVLNAAPIRDLPQELLDAVDLLIVNEHEADRLATQLDPARTSTPVTADEAARLAGELVRSVPAVILTLGAEGAVVRARDGDGATHVSGIRVTAVDTTGAGDTFCGALVAALDRSPGDLDDATRFATAAAALSVQRAGAVPSIPLEKEISDFRATH